MALVFLSLSAALLPAAPVISRPAFLSGNRAALIRCQETEIATPALESSCNFDFIPLLTALQAGEFREADQLTRDALITLAGKTAVGRGYVYFSEVPKLPVDDMATIERLWQAYSNGKFGYVVQARAFESKKVMGNFENFFDRIGWKNKDGTLLRWLPEAKGDEFIYDVEKAPKGHLPLTSALRGTQLLNGLLTHEAWDREGTRRAHFAPRTHHPQPCHPPRRPSVLIVPPLPSF